MFSSLYAFFVRRAQTDRQLLKRIRLGDESAFRSFYDMHVRATNYMAYGFMNQKRGAEDLAFETMREIWRGRTQIDVSKPAKVLIAETMILVYRRNIQAQYN
ncbi:MAG TPA: hypothetical protein VL547_20125 [Dinghuibacter sp.]|jgi:DNA-directed RNA polymerase specialized sigma24 family protein|uniref:hypothetical protein n=1 Tax=Dinghuibacter sp. TaxID=2024697 RepID=UPI002C6C3365|nr:hypothetical protein [Dinghuibacter sp.]HTJ14362.1 hypothetical protein [Dinghuibacter sp.]